jgi:hypothetical protein
MIDDRRLIEDFLPIQAISAEALREKSVRKGHISTLPSLVGATAVGCVPGRDIWGIGTRIEVHPEERTG